MLQVFYLDDAYVCNVKTCVFPCYFKRMLQVFLDVVKVDLVLHMLQ